MDCICHLGEQTPRRSLDVSWYSCLPPKTYYSAGLTLNSNVEPSSSQKAASWTAPRHSSPALSMSATGVGEVCRTSSICASGCKNCGRRRRYQHQRCLLYVIDLRLRFTWG